VGNKPKSLKDVFAPGDVIRTRMDDAGTWKLGQVPEVESALVSMNPTTGEIVALVGGYDFTRSKYNRITQSRRQPGSSFKPFVYSAALDKGFTTASLVNDAPIVFDGADAEQSWKPQNYTEKFYGPTRLREAMVNSRNLVSIRLLREIGVDYARGYIQRFGFNLEELPNNLTMALGTGSLTPLSMARGYSVFANSGYLVQPEFIQQIRRDTGEVVYQTSHPILCDDCLAETDSVGPESEAQAEPEPEEQPTELTNPELRPLEIDPVAAVLPPGSGVNQALLDEAKLPVYAMRVVSPQNAYLVRSMMMDVIRRGTGARAMELGRNDLAGKTGTTNEQRDAWFSGYNDHLVTTVWVGFDNHDPLGRNDVGGRAALPIWIEYMREALEGVADQPPKLPPGLAQAKINPATGLIATLDNSSAIMEIFEVGKLPPMEADSGTESQDVSPAEDPYEIY
jgi:penicillin-binding protein 1A